MAAITSQTRTRRVLVMDDEMSIRQLVCEMLRIRGHDCSEAADGREAIERFRQARQSGDPFDLVIMDLSIPSGMGGIQAVREILQIDPAAKVIVTSGSGTDPILDDYARFGFCGVLKKPFRVGDLHNLVAEC